jgi:hypothetical protein
MILDTFQVRRMDMMKRALLRAGLAGVLAFAAASVAGAANGDSVRPKHLTVIWGDTFQQRKDVDEVSRPLAPSGPTTPSPLCGPSSPTCP